MTFLLSLWTCITRWLFSFALLIYRSFISFINPDLNTFVLLGISLGMTNFSRVIILKIALISTKSASTKSASTEDICIRDVYTRGICSGGACARTTSTESACTESFYIIGAYTKSAYISCIYSSTYKPSKSSVWCSKLLAK